MKILARSERHGDRLLPLAGPGRKLCFHRGKHGLVPVKVTQVAAEECENIRPVFVVDRSDSVKTNAADSVNVVVHLERRPGRRFVSEVVEIHGYDPDRDEYNYGFIFDSHKELV